MNLRPSSLVRQFGVLAMFTQLLGSGCSSKEGATKDPLDNTPCNNELAGTCGGSCSKDGDCGNWQFCSSGSCTSQCTREGGQCVGTCNSNGTCTGSLITPVTAGPTDPDQPVIDDPSAGNGGSGGNGGTITDACATGNAEAKLSTVAMYIMFDQSLSMLDNGKWTNASSALTSFMQDPTTDGLNIALRFFPSNLPVEGCVDENAGAAQSCDPSLCEQPLVDVGLVTAAANDPQEQRLVDAITQASPGSGVAGAIGPNGEVNYQQGGGTPISAALGGAIQWAVKYQAAHQDEKAVVVFVTDGEPHGCDEGTNAITSIAREGANAGISTYSVGLEGSAPQLMQAIAEAGGTDDWFEIDTGNQAAASLLNALNSIRGKALSCDFPLPEANTGKAINPNEVNVTLTTPGGESAFFKVNSAADCGDDAAWYYDNNTNPTRMFLCENACNQVLSQTDASLEVVFGCATVTGPIIMN